MNLCDGDVFGLQLGNVKEASQTYDKAVKQTGGDAPGLYKLMGQLARHSTVPGSGVSVETLESSLAPAESLPASKLDDLEEAAPGVWLQNRDQSSPWHPMWRSMLWDTASWLGAQPCIIDFCMHMRAGYLCCCDKAAMLARLCDKAGKLWLVV